MPRRCPDPPRRASGSHLLIHVSEVSCVFPAIPFFLNPGGSHASDE